MLFPDIERRRPDKAGKLLTLNPRRIFGMNQTLSYHIIICFQGTYGYTSGSSPASPPPHYLGGHKGGYAQYSLDGWADGLL
jgi:hypothetical protein